MGIESDAGYQAYRERVFDFLWREVEPLMDEVERARNDDLLSMYRRMAPIRPGLTAYLTLVFDHRAADGEAGAAYLATLRELLEGDGVPLT